MSRQELIDGLPANLSRRDRRSRVQRYAGLRLALVGNSLRHGPSTVAGTPFFMLLGQGDLELYLADNLAQDAQGAPAPLLGRHTEEVLRADLDLSDAELAKLEASKTIETRGGPAQ